MQTTSRLVPFLFLVLTVGTVASVAANNRAASDGSDAMQAVLGDFHKLETHLEEGDSKMAGQAAVSFAATLRVARTSMVAPKNDDMRRAFYGYFDRLDAVAREVEVLAGSGQTVGALEALADARNSCVSCHLHYRQGESSNSYPARENTIAGRVTLKDVGGKKIQDRSWVLVFLEGPSIPSGHKSSRLSPEMGQEGRKFTPRVLPIVRGSSATFPNNDSVFHNVFSLSKPANFDLGIYPQGETRTVTFDRAGVVRVHCNIHPDMAATVVVLDNPFFSLTDNAGAFALTGVPDGKFELRAWDDMGGDFRIPVEVAGGEMKHVEFELRETRKPAPHTDKFGKRYKSKY